MTSTSEPPRLRVDRPEPDPIANDTRRSKRSRKLPTGAACCLCGESDVHCLIEVEVPRSWLEVHHVVTRAVNTQLLAVLCLTHHAKATALQWDVGALTREPAGSFLERMTRAMYSLGSFFELLAQACYRWARQLAGVVRTLDEALPIWRTLPGMS
jgi:hypothetical protein